MKTIALLVLALAVLTGCSDAPGKPEAKQPPAAHAVPVAVDHVAGTTQVIAYYFHGTVRCETCLKIEKQAYELIMSRFAPELASERLVFKPVNYDKPENAHFSKDYNLPCPSLVLVRQKGGKDQDWKLLGKTWDFVQIPPELDRYIEGEVDKFLRGAK